MTSLASSPSNSKAILLHEELVEKVRVTRSGVAKYCRAYQLLKRRTFQNWCCFGVCSPEKKDEELIERADQLSDAEIARFLRNSEYNTDRAIELAIETLQWRRDHGVDVIIGGGAEFMAQDKQRSVYWSGKDLQNRPILVCILRRHNPNAFSTETTIRYVLWKLEQKVFDVNVPEITLLLDFKGSNRQNWDTKVLKLLVPTLYKFHPRKLGLGLFYPMTTINWLGWKMISHSLTDETRDKFVFVENVESTGVETLLSQFSSFFSTSGNSKQGSIQDLPVDQELQNFESAEADEDDDDETPHAGSSTHARFTDFIAKGELERKYGGAKLEEETEGLDEEFEVAPFETEAYANFLDSQDEKLDTLVRMASVRSSSLDSSAGELSITAGESSSEAPKRSFGSTTKQVDPKRALEDKSIINAWSPISAKCFNVRSGPDYKKTKRKAPSGEALYDLLAMDLVANDQKQFHVASMLSMPSVAATKENKSGLPEILVISYAAPMYEPVNPMFHKTKSDGKGVAMSAVFRLGDWARQNPEAPAVELFRRYVNCFESDPFRERLKCIATIMNPDEMNLSRMEKALFSRYNSTPWLVRPQYKFFHGPGYFEIDIDIHTFAYFSRKVGWSVTKRLDNAIMDACLVLQTETNDEMPEKVLCCWRANRLQLNNAPLK